MALSGRVGRLWPALLLASTLALGGVSVAAATGGGGQISPSAKQAVPSRSAPVALDRLEAQVKRAIAGARGVMGVAIEHLESGVAVYVNGDESFPMASTFKLPVLVEMYAKASAGELNWDEMIDIGPLDQHLGSGELSRLYDPPGVKLSWHNLANLMMLISDNSAADLCLARVGTTSVNARLASLGVTGIRLDRPCQEFILDHAAQDTVKLKGLPFKELRAAMPRSEKSDEQRWALDDRFAADPRDTATPRSFASLLRKLWKREVVDGASSEAILNTMKRCTTGPARIKGLLPRGTEVAHKTGSMGGVFNDVGIIYLPEEAGHVAIAVLSKSARASSEQAERAIAEVARYAYDYFYFTGPPTVATAGRQ